MHIIPQIKSEHMMMSQDFRIEKDSLGELPVPAQGPLWCADRTGGPELSLLADFAPGGLLFGRSRLSSELQPKSISDLGYSMTAKWTVGSLRRKALADAIVEAAQEVMDMKWDAQFVVDPFQAGAGTSHNMNANEVIANRATQLLGGELGQYYVRPNDDVNMAQSTNDTIPTAIRLGRAVAPGGIAELGAEPCSLPLRPSRANSTML